MPRGKRLESGFLQQYVPNLPLKRMESKYEMQPPEERFGRGPDHFLQVGLSIGGAKVDYGDVGLEFQVLPRIPALFILWAADNEFPAKVNILFDPTIEHHLSLDTIWGLVRVITFKLLEY